MIDIISTLIFMIFVSGMILDYIYNSNPDFSFSLFPVILGFTIGLSLKMIIRKKGKKKEDGIVFVVIAFLVVIMALGVFHHFENQRFQRQFSEGHQREAVFEEPPEGITLYPISKVFQGDGERELKERRFPTIGQSFAIPRFYVQGETWAKDAEEWTISVKTYETRSQSIATILADAYIDFKRGGIIAYLATDWTHRADLEEKWQVDAFHVAKGYPAILIRKEEKLWIIEGGYRDFDLLATVPDLVEGEIYDGEDMDRYFEEYNAYHEEAKRLRNEEFEVLELNRLIEEILQ